MFIKYDVFFNLITRNIVYGCEPIKISNKISRIWFFEFRFIISIFSYLMCIIIVKRKIMRYLMCNAIFKSLGNLRIPI